MHMHCNTKDTINNNNSPDLGRQTNHREEHSLEVEVAKESFHKDSVDGERNLWNAEVEADANDVTFLERLLGRSN
jgi:hypothetical protein